MACGALSDTRSQTLVVVPTLGTQSCPALQPSVVGASMGLSLQGEALASSHHCLVSPAVQ